MLCLQCARTTQRTSAYCCPGYSACNGVVLYSELIPCNINNQYLGFNAVFCTCQVRQTQLYNPQLQGRLTKAVLKKACQSKGLIWLAVVFAELLGFCWRTTLFFSLGLASSSLSCLWLWCAEVMYNKFFTLSLLRQPWLQLKTDRERRDRGKIHRDRKKEEQRLGFLKEIGKFNH